MTLKRLFLLSLTAMTLTGCRDYLTETPTDARPTRAELPFVRFDGTAFVGHDAFVLLATTNSGKLLEIDVDAGTVRQLGQSQTFEGFKPGWTGITTDASGTVFTSSRTKDDPRTDVCDPFNGGTACTHLYNIDASTGLVTGDLGSMRQEQVSDIDSGAGIMYGSQSDVVTSLGRLVTINPVTAEATPVGFFSTAATGPIDDGSWLVNGGLSVDPTTNTIWGIENNFHWTALGPRLYEIDGATGAVIKLFQVKIGGAQPDHGFDGLEIMPDGRMFASRGPKKGGGTTPFELFEITDIDTVDGVATATLVSLTIPPGLGSIPNGLETTTAPRALTLEVTSATMSLDLGGNPGADDFIMDATFSLGAGNDGLDLTTEAFVLGIGELGFTLPAGSFSLVGGVFEYTSPGPGLTLVQVDESGGTLHVEGLGLTLTSLAGGPVAVNLQMGDDAGETTATFTAPAGIPPQPGGEFYAVTNRGELVILDFGAGTGTLIGTAVLGGGGGGGGTSLGWTGLGFSSDGRLFTSARWRDGNASDGCDGGEFPTDGKCAHVYQVDPGTGDIVAHVGNTGIQYLSDLQFGTDGLLLGNEFINLRPLRDGGLVKIDLATGSAARKGTFGTFDALVVGNGGLALHPGTGQLWGIESNDLFPRIFQIDPVTGAGSSPVKLVLNGEVLDFGFDGLGILPDGRFYATRGRGFAEVYRIDPGSGEVRLQDLTLDPSITGGLNGLDIFVAPSGTPPAPVDIGVKDTFIRKDKSAKSGKSGKSGKSARAQRRARRARRVRKSPPCPTTGTRTRAGTHAWSSRKTRMCSSASSSTNSTSRR